MRLFKLCRQRFMGVYDDAVNERSLANFRAAISGRAAYVKGARRSSERVAPGRSLRDGWSAVDTANPLCLAADRDELRPAGSGCPG